MEDVFKLVAIREVEEGMRRKAGGSIKIASALRSWVHRTEEK
jgi:hypothetical protein